MISSRIFYVLFFLLSAGVILLLIKFDWRLGGVYRMAWVPFKISDPAPSDISESAPSKIRGAMSNCTDDDIKKRPGVMLLTTTNLEFLDMAVNMLMSIRKIGLCVNTTVIAEDEKAFRYLKKRTDGDPGIHAVKTNSGEAGTGEIVYTDSEAYFMFLKKRQGYVLNLLEQGYEVLFSDADTFWFRDPFPYFKGNFDMSMMDPESPYPQRTPRAHYCTGFAYMKPTIVTIQFVKAWMDYLKKNNVMDQIAMNNLLRADKPVHVNIQPLDVNLFPYGPLFYESLKKNASYSCVVMHAANFRGHPKKVAKFKSSNMWLVNATSEQLLARDDKNFHRMREHLVNLFSGKTKLPVKMYSNKKVS